MGALGSDVLVPTAIIVVVSAVVVLRQCFRGGGLAHPLVLIVGFYGLSHAVIPAGYMLGLRERYFWTVDRTISSPSLSTVAWIECATLVFLLGGLLLGMRGGKARRGSPQGSSAVSARFALFWLVVGVSFAVMWIATDYSRLFGLPKGYYQWERAPVRQLLVNGTRIFTLLGMWLCALSWREFTRPLRVFVALSTLGLLAFYTVLLQRGPILGILLLWWVAAGMREPGRFKLRRDAAFAAGIAILFIVANLAVQRAMVTPTGALAAIREARAENVTRALAATTHFGYAQANFTAAMDLMPDVRLWGMSYVAALVNLVPSPLLGQYLISPFALEFSRTVVGGSPAAGANMSLEAEAFLNFGYAGPPLVFFFYAYIIGYAYRRACQGNRLYQAWYVLLSVALLGHYAASAQSLAKMWIYSYALLFLAATLRRLRGPSVRRARSQPAALTARARAASG